METKEIFLAELEYKETTKFEGGVVFELVYGYNEDDAMARIKFYYESSTELKTPDIIYIRKPIK